MRIIGTYCSVEKGVGWLHVLTVTDDAGTVITIEDDTDTVSASSNKPNALTPQQIAQIWRDNKMGTSTFKTSGQSVTREFDLEHQILPETSGVEISRL